jgi:hypothetical protein
LQIEAIRLLVSRRDPQTNGAVLRELYESSQDPAVKRAVIDAYGAFRNRSNGPQPANGNTTGGLQASTAPQELMALYQKETDTGLRRQIAAVLVSIGGVDQAIALAKGESDPRVRQAIIGMMGGRRSDGTTAALVDLYRSSPDADTREGVINALSGQQNAEALIGLARAETDLKLKTRMVRALSEMAPRSKAAADFLMDVIK